MSLIYNNTPYMPSWSENGAKKCHILVKSFTYKSDLKKKKKS